MPQSRRPPLSTSASASKTKKQSSSKQINNPKASSQASKSKRDDNNTQSRAVSPLVLEPFKAILNLFHESFSHLFTPNLPSLIQDVKQSLFLRDYVAAFSSQEKLQAYTVRWSVARALAYFEMLSNGWWSDDVKRLFVHGHGDLNISCIGGGAGAELVAIAAARSFLDSAPARQSANEEALENQSPADTGMGTSSTGRMVRLNLLDFATWDPITNSLYETMTTPNPNSALRLKKSQFAVNCHQQDVLSPLSESAISCLASANLITILFTAGELYSQSPTAATKFFMALHPLTKPGTILVVVDSAGGFEDLDVLNKKAEDNAESTIVGGFKLGFLLDRTLTSKGKWHTLVSDDARWWRVPQELKDSTTYPLPLENMRSLVRVYLRNDD